MVVTTEKLYDVGGVLQERPFKIRRLGHVGFALENFDEGLRFYRQLLGFRVSDVIDRATRVPPGTFDGMGDTKTYFMRYAGDHHSFVINSRAVGEKYEAIRNSDAALAYANPLTNPAGKMAAGAARPEPRPRRKDSLGQKSWQVDSLAEIVNGFRWLKDQEVRIDRAGRDMPGSNWHTYFRDPEGLSHEIYYGMEQIGWDGVTKPKELYRDRFTEEPPLPQRSEGQEIADGLRDGIDMSAGNRDPEDMPLEYEVDGVMLARPFRIVNMSPLGLFMDDLGTALTFYTDVMGFKETERNTVLGEPAHYLRLNSEHHSLALYPASLKAKLGLQAQSTCAVLGFQVANYKQLRNAVAFLQAEGYSLFDAPPEFQTGTDYAAHFLDPDGHCIRLYHSMEQVNWNGDPRPQDQRSILPVNQWPDALRDSPSAYSANIFQGPLG
jgi:catechol 2,3-dioxygenase-like lactoylglutathione lyase family enzyme